MLLSLCPLSSFLGRKESTCDLMGLCPSVRRKRVVPNLMIETSGRGFGYEFVV